MANISLKSMLEASIDPKLIARSKESGKLVYFKSPEAKAAAVKAGSHEEPKKDKKVQSKQTSQSADIFTGDYSKERGIETPKADVKSIVKGILKNADKEFAGVHKLKDIVDDVEFDISDADGKDLQSRIDKGEDGTYVQTDETEGIIVFNDGTQYQLHHVEDGPIPVTKVGNDSKKNTSKVNLPKKASELTYKHSPDIQNMLDSHSGLKGIAQINDNSGAIEYTASSGENPTYTLFIGPNDDYGKPDEYRVSLESTYGNDPLKLTGKNDKSFKSAKDAMVYMTALAKKYQKELQMDDEKNESTKLTSMIKK